MAEYKTDKPDPGEVFQEFVENLSKQPAKVDRDLVGEYFYWMWRSLLFVLALVFLSALWSSKPLVTYLKGISATEWAGLAFLGLIGPLVFVGWSYFWMWLQRLFR